MLRLTLVRHAATEWNAAHRYQGWSDPPLSPVGEAQARALGVRLKGRRYDRVLASDLRRCRETAALALPGTPAGSERRLRELHFGAWEGLTYEECLARDPEAYSAWLDDPAGGCPPEGETLTALRERLLRVVEELPAAGELLWITHGGPIRALLAEALELPFERAARLTVSACGLTRLLRHAEGWIVESVNDTAHLESPRNP